ncbi:MAG: recombinase family protein, partial [Candidatus Melainabacteria bacterium]|nr:recombinase family protein [Candidatus Melainabacteria bacterium]
MRYFIYCRKSSEEEERQALSIESQLQELREYAQKQGLMIVKEFTESKSAKKPGREVFNEMLSKIEAGEADGILAW